MKERKSDEQGLNSLKRETRDILEKNNQMCNRIWDINRSLEKKSDAVLLKERDTLTKTTEAYKKQIHDNYNDIVRLEKEVNNRDIDPSSPTMKSILHEEIELPKLKL
jgi:hypothetical protein